MLAGPEDRTSRWKEKGSATSRPSSSAFRLAFVLSQKLLYPLFGYGGVVRGTFHRASNSSNFIGGRFFNLRIQHLAERQQIRLQIIDLSGWCRLLRLSGLPRH